MTDQQNSSQTPPLGDLDPVIHAPARLNIMMILYVVDSLDYVFLKNQTGLSWGNLATHLGKLEQSEFIEVEKGYQGKKPHSMIRLTEQGRNAFRAYKNKFQQLLDDLPE